MPGAVNTDAEDLAIAATSAERTEGAARAEASLLAQCRVTTEEDGVNVGNAASGSAESIMHQ